MTARITLILAVVLIVLVAITAMEWAGIVPASNEFNVRFVEHLLRCSYTASWHALPVGGVCYNPAWNCSKRR